MGGWLGLGLRQLLFTLPALCMAASQATLCGNGGGARAAAVLPAAAVASAWGALHPRTLDAATGLQPWVELPGLVALAALALAAGAASLLRHLQLAGLRLLLGWRQRERQSTRSLHQRQLGWLRWAAAAAASSLLHPALPLYLGCLCLALRVAARDAAAGAGGQRQQQQLEAWLAFYSQLALLPSVGLWCRLYSGGGGGGEEAAAGWSDGQALVVALAMHACLLAHRGGLSTGRGGSGGAGPKRRQLLQGVVHEAAACASAAASLWGHPYLALYAAAVSAAADVMLSRM